MVTRHLEKANVRVEREGKSWTISRTLQNLEIQFLFKKYFRGNSRGYDLNRNFPDFFKPNTKRTQPETDAVKDWISKIQFLLSGSLHGGALVCTEKKLLKTRPFYPIFVILSMLGTLLPLIAGMCLYKEHVKPL